MSERKRLIAVVIDGLTPSMLEASVDARRTPALALLADNGRYRRAVSTFPSLTPVCLSSIATGAHPDVHEIPHLVWYHRGDARVVEYGSSWAAVRAAGARRSVADTVFNMNQQHLGANAVTVFEALEDAGVVTAAVNITCYRGRTRHAPLVPGITRAAYGPRRFFYYSLFESDRTGAPIGVVGRHAGSLDAYAANVGRWLVTRDGFEFLVYYLPDYDYASHARGPDAAHEALDRADRSVGTLIDAAGGPDDFLDRYAVVLCSDHGQSRVERPARLQDAFAGNRGVVVTASNRAGMVYRLPRCEEDVRALAARIDDDPAVEVTLFREGDEAVARREGAEVRFRPAPDGWAVAGDAAILDHPNALERAWAALANPNAGELLVSAAPRYEFADLAGRHHAGGGSHGSLAADDSLVPMLTVGVDLEPASITDVAPLALAHFGVEPPAYSRVLPRAA